MRSLIGFKFVTAIAAAALLAACSSTPEGSGAVAAGGTGATQTASAPSDISAEPGSAQDFIENVGDRVFFDFDRFELSAEAQSQLQQQAAWLQTYPTMTITVEGHADERGTREYNLALGERRSASVRNYLVALGIDPNRLQTISYGKERPEALGADESAWAQNRRGVSVVN